jgi:hypothetical protein
MEPSQREFYLRSIRSALSYQTQQKPRWDDSLDFLRLSYFDKRSGNDLERTEVHYVHAYYNTLIPTLYSKNPTLFVKARKPSSLPLAETMEQVLNYYKDELKMKPAVQSAIADTVPYGLGWVEVGYTPPSGSYRPSYKKKPSMLQEAKQKLNELLSGPNPEERVEGQLLPDVRGGRLFLRWIPAYRVLLAPGYHSVNEMPYLIVVDDVAPEEFAANPRYNPSVVEQAKPTRTVSSKGGKVLTPQPSLGQLFKPRAEGDSKFIRTYHIHDRRNLRKVGFVEGIAEELYDEPWGCAFDEFNLVPLIFNDSPPSEDDANAYPMDDITPIKPQLIEKSLLRTSMIKMRRRMAPIILVDKDLYSEAEIALMQETEEAIIIPVRGGAKGFFATQPVRIPNEIFQVDSTINGDLDMVGGFAQLLETGSKNADETATAQSLRAQGTTMRQSRKVDLIESFLVEIARRMAAYALQYHDAVDIAEIIGKPVSEEMWPDVEGMDEAELNKLIRQELNFKIEAGSTQPDQIRLIEQNLAIRNTNMITAAFPNAIDQSKLLRFHMKKMNDKEFEYVLKPETEPSQQEAMQENQLMAQGMLQIAHRGDRHDVHIPIHGTQAQQMAAMGIDTSMIDQHIQMHSQLMQMEMPQKGKAPQSGDTSSPQQAAVPELQRTGGEDMADMQGQAGNSVQMGPENSLSP